MATLKRRKKKGFSQARDVVSTPPGKTLQVVLGKITQLQQRNTVPQADVYRPRLGQEFCDNGHGMFSWLYAIVLRYAAVLEDKGS